MFEYRTTIKMYDVDAAGVLFFANQFRLVHDAYEAMLETRGLPLGEWLKNAPFFLPVVHASTDYKMPLRVGDAITIKLRLESKGNTSITLGHDIYKNSSQLAGTGKTVHVSIDRNTGQKIPLPKEIQKLF